MSSTILRRLLGVIAAFALVFGVAATTASPAHAASGTVWDRVAKCESGGNWKINTGNGYYGGLQFSASTWRGFGGRKYASQANRATKAEQIAIARRVLAGQGAGAWASCGRRAGLTKSNGKASKSAVPSTNPGSAKAPAKKSSKKSTAKSKASKAKKSTKASTKKSVTVKRGDTLRKLAKKHDVAGGWKGLYKLNKSKLKNPNSIYVGQVLKIKK